MDSDRENAFWREGGPSYIHKNNYPKIKRRISSTKNRLENRDANPQPRYHRNAAPIYPVSYKNNQWPITRRRSTRKIANFTTTETTDEEYLALYKKSSVNKETDKSVNRSFSKSSGECVVEPIETILSRYQRKSSKSSTELLESESSINALEISDQINSKEKLNKSSSMNETSNISTESPEDGKWIERNCFGSVWYSKSELNIKPERKSVTRTRNQISRIPRLRHSPEKRSARDYRTKNDSSGVCQ